MMSHDLQDRLLTWISNQEELLKKRIMLGGNISYAEGQYFALLDVKVFIMTNGQLYKLTPEPQLIAK